MADEEEKATVAEAAPPEEVTSAPPEEPTSGPPEEPTSGPPEEVEAAPSAEQQAGESVVPPAEGSVEQKEENKEAEAPATETGGGEGEASAVEEKPPEEGEKDEIPAEVENVSPAPQEEPDGTEEKKPAKEAASQQHQKDEMEEQAPEEKAEEDGEAPLPQSDDFATGEKPEGELEVVAEALSRGDTPVVPPDGIADIDMVPGTPEKEIGEEKGVIFEEEEEIVPKLSREELMDRYNAALRERETLNQKNHALQHKLAEYFKRKKTEDSRQEVDRNVTDQEQRYMKYMSNLDELRQQEAVEKDCYNEQIEEMKERKAAKQALVEEEWKQYCDFKRSVALSSVNSRSGRPLTLKEFEIYETNEVKKEAEVSQVRLENIKLRNRLRKREMQLKQKEELAEGLHLIDFEQLKIENQTYNEKIEERNEELMKLRKKITSTVQVLTHLKEKLQFVQGENQVAKQELAHIDAEVAGKRDVLSRTKQARDALRHDNSKLQQKCGLLGNRLLLRDYEDGTDEITDLSHRLDHLKRSHAELTLSISGVKKKIEQARAQAQS